MKLFRKHQEDAVTNQLAEKVARYILKRQLQLADFLNGKVQRFSHQTIRIALIGFSSTFGVYCLYLVIKAFN